MKKLTRKLIEGRRVPLVGDILTRRDGTWRVTEVGKPYPVDGDMEDDMGAGGGGFTAGTSWHEVEFSAERVE